MEATCGQDRGLGSIDLASNITEQLKKSLLCLCVPAGKFEEEETFQAWTKRAASKCEVCDCIQARTPQERRSEEHDKREHMQKQTSVVYQG